MASNNQVPADNLAIVPYEPSQQTIPTLSQAVLAPQPISYAFPSHMISSGRRRRSLQTARKSEQISIDQFALNLPEDYLKYLFSKEQVLLEHKKESRGAPHGRWFTISYRLKGWECERRLRSTKNQVDKNFYHANMKLRSIKELTFYVKYGFMPRKSQEKINHKILEEAGLSSSRGRSSQLDYEEEELINKFNINRDVIVQLNEHIKAHLLWTKHPQEPAGNIC
ncbi:hypothetical protein POM88_009826 [Heracleum sosnowskyi]|uniref:Uncharacterized protein n=1 Tax=Heracleum sosnowskyi TaxID=360622 RepID=A0AAD8N9Y2_9APIA|nr:hypothetical protein POM88_009826 [Heracleum sosnowskyi]